MLIEGEALLNDGTAMVFYQVFVGIAKKEVFSFCILNLLNKY